MMLDRDDDVCHNGCGNTTNARCQRQPRSLRFGTAIRRAAAQAKGGRSASEYDVGQGLPWLCWCLHALQPVLRRERQAP